MSVNTILLDFSVDPSEIKNENQISLIATNIENVLRDYLKNLKLITTINTDGTLFKLYSSDNGNIINLRLFSNGLITLNMEYFKGNEQDEALFNYDQCKELANHIKKRIDVIGCYQALVPLKRCTFVRYMPTSDERLLEYDIDKIVFEERTPYQKVQIVHSKTLGNILILDDLQNISEADLIYTETLMARGIENYKDKEIIILGGGDGALLYEILKENPKEVIMLEIDEIVMKACAKYMRSVCGNVLDNMFGENYKIIIGDCIKTMEKYIKDERKFDYIFGDLTDVPISSSSTEGNEELWNFINKILTMSFKILKPNGKYMTHVTGTASDDVLKMYEKQLFKLKPSVKFTTSHAFIPSFLEDWKFYQISFA